MPTQERYRLNWIVIIVVLLSLSVCSILTLRSLSEKHTFEAREVDQKLARLAAELVSVQQSVSDALRGIKDQLSALEFCPQTVTQELSDLLRRMRSVETRIEAIETSAAGSAASVAPPRERDDTDLMGRYTDPISLPPRLQAAFEKSPSSRMIAQNGVESIVASLWESEVCPYQTMAEMPEKTRGIVSAVFDVFLESTKLITVQENLSIQLLILEADRDASFEELPDEEVGASLRFDGEMNRGRGPGAGAVRKCENGSKRYYYFPYQDYPQLLEAFADRDNAKKHLIANIAEVLGR